MIYGKIAFVTIMMVLTAGCSAEQIKTADISQKASPNAEATHSVSSKKLSAAVSFSHDFKGSASIGSVQTINLQAINKHIGGSATYELRAPEGLQIFQKSGFEETTESFDGESGHDMTFQFQPKTEGVHEIVIYAKVNLADGQFMTQAQAIKVYVGDDFQPSKQSAIKPAESKEPKQSGGLSIMEAEETIED